MWLGCLREISTVTGFGLALEIGNWARSTGKTISAIVGLAPSERSAHEHWDRSPSPATATPADRGRCRLARRRAHRAGKTHARPLASRRLHQQWTKFIAHDKRGNIAAIAIAREPAGRCWSLAVVDPDPQPTSEPTDEPETAMS